MTARKSKVLILYYDSTVDPFGCSGFKPDDIMNKLSELKKRNYEVKIYDTAGWPARMIKDVYTSLSSALSGKYDLDRVFASPQHKRLYFGRQMPALLVYHDGNITHIYPLSTEKGLITIADYLDGLLRGGET